MSEYEHVPRLDEGSDELMGQLLRAARKEVPDEQRMDALSLALLDKMGPGGPDGGPDGSDGSGGAEGGADPGGAEGLGGPTGAELAQGAQAATGAGASVAPTTAAAGAGSSIAVKATLGTLAALVVAAGVYTATRSAPPAPPPQAATTVPAAAPAAVEPKAASTKAPAPVVSIDDLPKLAEPPKAATPGGATTAPSAEPVKKRTTADAMADLRRAQDALGSNPARALQLIAEHRRDYPRSAFSQERDVLEIDALLRLGRRSEAVAKGDQFAKYYPKSGHRRRIDALLGR